MHYGTSASYALKQIKTLCYSMLVEGQNGIPLLGLCHFIPDKNGVQAYRLFMDISFIEV